MELFDWIYKLVLGSLGKNLQDIATLIAIFLTGIIGSTIMVSIFRTLSLKFLGNLIFGLIGGYVGAYFFILTVYGMAPRESSLVNFDNDLNLDVLFGIILGGLIGGFLITFTIGLLKNIVFGRSEG